MHCATLLLASLLAGCLQAPQAEDARATVNDEAEANKTADTPAREAADTPAREAADTPAREADDPPAQPESRQQVFRKLVAHSWANPKGNPKFPTPDWSEFIFYPDGRYSIQMHTDYAVGPDTGRWNFAHVADLGWVLLFDRGHRIPITFHADGSLQIRNQKLVRREPLESPQPPDVDDLPPLVLADEVLAARKLLTATRWKHANDLEPGRFPSALTFYDDWTYETSYAPADCTNRGWWHTIADQLFAFHLSGDGTIWSNANPCGESDHHEAFRLELLDENHVLLGGDLYVPVSRELERGIIYNVMGHGVVNVRVEYEMPLRAKETNEFSVAISLRKSSRLQSLNLQRFALTSEYQRDFRQSRTEIAIGEEIAGVDLQNRVLRPGESVRFKVPVVFDEPGKQWVYLNAMMYGETQAFDARQAREFQVRPAR